jgi:hypothetical protein
MNLKFWEWFKKKQESDPTLVDPTDAAILREYQDAIGIQRIPMQSIDRHDLTANPVDSPDLGKDDAETLKMKLKYGIHQSTMRGADTHTISGVRAIAEEGGKAEVIMKIDKSKLYELGYDISTENDTFVKALGLEPETSVSVPEGTPEEERLRLEHVEFHHYSGKPQDRPWEMRPAPPCAVNSETGDSEPTESYPTAVAELVVPEMEESIKARIEAFHAKAKDHDPSCEWYEHYTEHINEQGMEFDCLHATCFLSNCKGNHGDDQGDAVPV